MRGPFRRLSVTAFYRRAKELIDWARPTGADDVPWETRNVEEARFRGLEADMEVRGPQGVRVSAGAAILSVTSEEAEGFQSKYALRPFRERFTLGLGRTFEGGFSFDLHAQRGVREGEEAFHRVDVKTGYRRGAMAIYLNANNLLDADYPDPALPPPGLTAIPAPGRALTLGLEVGGG
jgi:outer membrane receptor protein involved in Fe transport